MVEVSEGVAQVEGQLRAVRTRLNGLTAQTALSVALASCLLLSGALVVMALRAPQRMFPPIATGAALVAVAVLAGCAWFALRRWVTTDDVVRLVDRRASLDDRLTTLRTASGAPSALWPLLIEQSLETRARWHPDRLAPRRIARTTHLVPFALAVLAAAAFYGRPPRSQPSGDQGAHAALLAPAGRAADRAPGSDQIGARAIARTEGGQSDAAGRAEGRAQSQALAGLAGAGLAPVPHADGGPAEPGQMRQEAAQVPAQEGSAEALRQAIRAAFAATPDDDGKVADGTEGRAGNRPDGTATHDTGGPADRSGAQTGARRSDAHAPERRDDGDTGSGRGGGAGSHPGGLLGGQPADNADPASGSAKPVAVALRAFAVAAPSDAEPQIPPGAPAGVAAGAAGERTLPALDAQQTADAALQRSLLAPEHELVVRNVFTRE